jgi:hypothetical protein
MPHRVLPLALLLLAVAAAPAGARIPDREDQNDDVMTVDFGLTGGSDHVSDDGTLRLERGDVDFVGLSSLAVGDVITAVTTPLQDELLEFPDTVVGIFDASGLLLVQGDDVVNHDDTSNGLGSLARYVVDVPGDYFVGVTGVADIDYSGNHMEKGSYVLSVSVADPLGATAFDDEPANDTRATAATALMANDGIAGAGGILGLTAGDLDFLAIENVMAGDVITAVTSPLENEFLEMPDTVLALFDSDDAMAAPLVTGDDAENDETSGTGFGSLLRFVASAGGTYYVGVSGLDPMAPSGFGSGHTETGSYALNVSATPLRTPFLVWLFDSSEDQVLNSGVGDGSTDSTATGRNIIVYDPVTELMTFTITWDGLGGEGLTKLHIHGPATPEESNPTHLFEFFNSAMEIEDAGLDRTSDRWTETRFVARDSQILQTLIDGDAYVNVHSDTWPTGEIRGNLRLAEPGTFSAWAFESTEDQVLNSGVGDGSTDSTAFGRNFFVHDPVSELMSFTMTWDGLGNAGLTKLHIHGPATPQESNATYLFEFFNSVMEIEDAGLDPVSDVWSEARFVPNGSQILQTLVDGDAYVNVHSALWPTGEIRGNLLLLLPEPSAGLLGAAALLALAGLGRRARRGRR